MVFSRAHTLVFTGSNQLGPEEYKRHLIKTRFDLLNIDQAGRDSGFTVCVYLDIDIDLYHLISEGVHARVGISICTCTCICISKNMCTCI